ncbi:hypothetical protein HispidOSU_028741, partial [Sigmodon hispidus]
MDLPAMAVLGDSFTVTTQPNYTCREWRVKGQPLWLAFLIDISCLMFIVCFSIVFSAENTG